MINLYSINLNTSGKKHIRFLAFKMASFSHFFSAYLSYLEENMGLQYHHVHVSAPPPPQYLLNQWTDFHEIYQHYATRGNCTNYI
jgi:surface antigen